MEFENLIDATFDESGYLFDKVHQMDLPTFIQRFCGNPKSALSDRTAYKSAIADLFEWASNTGVASLIIGGSFVTSKPNPDDLDVLVIFSNSNPPEKLPRKISSPGVIIDAQSLSESEPELIQAFIQLIGTDKRGVGRGVVQIKMHPTMHLYEKRSVDPTLFNAALLSYVFRSRVRTAPDKKLVIPIHGIRSDATWISRFTLLASTSGWAVAPFMYGYENVDILLDEKKKAATVNNLRLWIDEVRQDFDGSISVVAHSFGSYVIGRYLQESGFLGIRFAGIVLAGSILNSDYPWKIILDDCTVTTVLNTRSKKDQWVKMIPEKFSKWRAGDKLMGRAAVDGFTTKHSRLIERESNLLDHNNMFGADVIKRVWLPFLEMAHLEENRAIEIAKVEKEKEMEEFSKKFATSSFL